MVTLSLREHVTCFGQWHGDCSDYAPVQVQAQKILECLLFLCFCRRHVKKCLGQPTCPRMRDALSRADPASLQSGSEMQSCPAEPHLGQPGHRSKNIINYCFKPMSIWVICCTAILIHRAIFKSKYLRIKFISCLIFASNCINYIYIYMSLSEAPLVKGNRRKNCHIWGNIIRVSTTTALSEAKPPSQIIVFIHQIFTE